MARSRDEELSRHTHSDTRTRETSTREEKKVINMRGRKWGSPWKKRAILITAKGTQAVVKSKHKFRTSADPEAMVVKEAASLLMWVEQATRKDGMRDSLEKRTGSERRREGTMLDNLPSVHSAYKA